MINAWTYVTLSGRLLRIRNVTQTNCHDLWLNSVLKSLTMFVVVSLMTLEGHI